MSTDVALQASVYNQVRAGLTASAMEHFRPAMLKLNESVGLVVVDEGSEEWLTDRDNDCTSAANTVPDDWGAMRSVYATNVPPWYKQSAVTAMIGATGDTKVVADWMRFSVGELRSCTWKITGPQVEQLVGHSLRSTEGGSSYILSVPVNTRGSSTRNAIDQQGSPSQLGPSRRKWR